MLTCNIFYGYKIADILTEAAEWIDNTVSDNCVLDIVIHKAHYDDYKWEVIVYYDKI